MTANFSPALAGFGPGSAFAGFPTPAARPPRRVASSGSFKDDSRSAPPHFSNGPTPIDHQKTPSLGSWESSDRERQNSTSSLHSHGEGGNGGAGRGEGGLTNGYAHPAGPAHQRSFSSILSPSLPATNEAPVQDPLAKPFVYSREFLLSLYDEDKASRRPIELARHEIATKDRGGKPWALSDWRDGEKEVSSPLPLSTPPFLAPRSRRPLLHASLVRKNSTSPSPPQIFRLDLSTRANQPPYQLFATSIHPPTSRTTNSSSTRGSGMHRTDSTPASTTLDLSTLGQLPRERDRALASPSPASRSSLTAGIGNSADNGRRARGTLGTMGASNGNNGMGILGGVLGGIGGARPLGSPGAGRKEGSVGASPAGTKEVWQGGRWRRGGTAEEEDKVRSLWFSRWVWTGADKVMCALAAASFGLWCSPLPYRLCGRLVLERPRPRFQRRRDAPRRRPRQLGRRRFGRRRQTLPPHPSLLGRTSPLPSSLPSLRSRPPRPARLEHPWLPLPRPRPYRRPSPLVPAPLSASSRPAHPLPSSPRVDVALP